MKFPTGREFETRVECALETYFVAGRFATVWALRLRVPDEFIAGGLHKEQSTCLGTVSQAIARWQRGSSAGSVINWIFYCSIDCCSSYGNRAWFRYLFSLSNNDKESFSSTRDLTRRLNQAKCLLHGLTPTASKWTLHASWFPRRGDNRNGPGGSTSPWNYGSCWLEKKAAQPCPTSRRLNESLKLIKIILFPNIVH